jgi:hypothetical protein
MSKKTGQHYDIHKFSSDRALAFRILIMLNNKLLAHFLNGEPRSREIKRLFRGLYHILASCLRFRLLYYYF